MNQAPYTLFISDLHLDPRNIGLTKSFLFFMRDHAGAEAIYILGDFFNAFIGEDDDNAYIEQIKASCRAYTQTGGKLYIMAGNRDFLMQHAFAESVCGTYIADPTIHTIYGLKCLLMHGDSLCTDDIQHQKWRNIYTRSWVHGVAHLIPLKIRQWLAKRMRKHSKARKATQDLSIMDTNPQAVLKAITDSNCDYLIHGHTHLPQDHGRRLVLGAWPDADSIIKLEPDHSFTRLSP
jgi:UDP-2,3-diacylglucosamine hydrolase